MRLLAAPVARIAALTTFAIAVACTPSSSANAGRTTAAAGDSSPDAPHTAAGPSAADDTTQAPDRSPVATAAPPERLPQNTAARPVYVPPPSGPYRVHVVDENHRDLPTFFKDGRSYVMGTVGARYGIAVTNPTGRRVEAVVSVDGLDAVDGRPASYVDKRGYILQPYGDMTIEGFRTSMDQVATFRFSSVAESYAGRLGDARDVGVIGVAFFPERAPVYVPPPPQLAEDQRRRAYRRAPSAMPRHVAPSDLPDSPVPPPAPPAAAAPTTPADQATANAGGAADSTRGATAKAPAERSADRPGLGTEFGEARESRIQSTEFTRASPTSPSQVVAIRYNNRAGLLALGIALPPVNDTTDRDLRLRETAQPFRETQFAQAPP